MEEFATLDFDVTPTHASRLPEVDFDNLAFGQVFSDHMFVMDYEDGEWQRGEISSFGPMTFSPAMMSLHYGQAIFEGMKAFKQEDGGVSLFRPGSNIARFNFSARRMSMPEVPEDSFMQALVELVKLDQGWVPGFENSALYIRPFMFATEAHVGVRPSKSFRFCIFTCPVGAYYTRPVRVKVEQHFTRAAHGGTGAAKAAGNYAGSLYPTELAKSEGFDQILWDRRCHPRTRRGVRHHERGVCAGWQIGCTQDERHCAFRGHPSECNQAGSASRRGRGGATCDCEGVGRCSQRGSID